MHVSLKYTTVALSHTYTVQIIQAIKSGGKVNRIHNSGMSTLGQVLFVYKYRYHK